MRSFQALSLLLTLLIFSSVSFAQVVATVGNKKITKEEFTKKYEEVKSRAFNAPSKEDFLEDLIRFEMGVQEAEKKNIEKDPAVQERIRSEIYKGLLEKELSSDVAKIKIDDKEMQAFYKKNPEIRSSHILIEIKAGATRDERTAAEKRAKEIYEDVKKSKRPFEELVKLYSDDVVTKQIGGDVGWQTRMTLVPAYYDAIKSTAVDKIVGLIDTNYGFHIIKVTGRHSFEEADKRQIRAAAAEVDRRKLFDRYFEGLKKRYKVSVNKGALK